MYQVHCIYRNHGDRSVVSFCILLAVAPLFLLVPDWSITLLWLLWQAPPPPASLLLVPVSSTSCLTPRQVLSEQEGDHDSKVTSRGRVKEHPNCVCVHVCLCVSSCGCECVSVCACVCVHVCEHVSPCVWVFSILLPAPTMASWGAGWGG